MADLLVLEFSGVTGSEYEAVNKQLGIDMTAGTGDWPAGLLTHAAGLSDDGTFVVTELWRSRADQGAFMESRLGAALAAGGITAAPSVKWVTVVAHHEPGL